MTNATNKKRKFPRPSAFQFLSSAGFRPNATRNSMQTETRSQSPGGRYDNSPTFEFEGWVRSPEDPTSPERDGRLQLQGISVRIDIGYSAFSRPVGTQCNRKFVVPNLQRLGYCQTSLRDKGKILAALGRIPGSTAAPWQARTHAATWIDDD